MRETLIVIGLLVLAIALRTCKGPLLRKMGAFLFVGSSILGMYFITGSLAGSLTALVFWILLPLVGLAANVRKLRLPKENRLRSEVSPRDSFFPHAPEAVRAIEEEGFEHIGDCGWDWAGMHQHFRNFWHPDECAIATVCLCQQENIAFAFVSVTTKDKSGHIWRTTNFPFSPTLKIAPDISLKYLPCERKCFHQILENHREFVLNQGLKCEDLLFPDPECVDKQIEQEMKAQIEYNLEAGVLQHADGSSFRYSWKGILFLWRQVLKDMIRLC